MIVSKRNKSKSQVKIRKSIYSDLIFLTYIYSRFFFSRDYRFSLSIFFLIGEYQLSLLQLYPFYNLKDNIHTIILHRRFPTF